MSDSAPPSPPEPASLPPQAPPAKKGKSSGCIVALVIGMVGLIFLMALLFPIVASWFVRSSRGEHYDMVQMKSLEMGIKGYQTEYNRLPSVQAPPPSTDNSPGYNTTESEGRAIIDILTATDTSKNPRGISFYEPPIHKSMGGYTPERGLVDVWGTHGYIIIFDYNSDKEIADPEHPGATIAAPVIIYSAGADGDFNTWRDNLKSWDNR